LSFDRRGLYRVFHSVRLRILPADTKIAIAVVYAQQCLHMFYFLPLLVISCPSPRVMHTTRQAHIPLLSVYTSRQTDDDFSCADNYYRFRRTAMYSCESVEWVHIMCYADRARLIIVTDSERSSFTYWFMV